MSVYWRRRFGTGYFSISPLNYETLTRRCRRFKRQNQPTADAVIDYISANRRLQHINRNDNLRYNTNTPKAADLNLHLDLPLNVSSKQLENELWQFLQEYWLLTVADENIVKHYFASSPSVDVSRAFQLVTKNYAYNLDRGRLCRDTVLALVHVLLDRGDYDGCFKIIDLTFGSKRLLELMRKKFYRKWGWGALLALAVGIFQFCTMPLLPLPPLLLLDCGVIFGTMYGFDRINFSELLGRVSWRPYTSIMHRMTHKNEIQTINKMVTYFEEHNEVNVKNYHNSLIRNVSAVDTLSQYDYELQLPNSTELILDNLAPDEKVESMAKYFRSKLNKRRLLWNLLKEEQMLIDFWVAHGENFEWVEPDQDPAEMVHFREWD